MWKYNQPTEELVEQPTMSYPLQEYYFEIDGAGVKHLNKELLRKDLDAYHEHIASRRHLKISGPHSWKHEQDVLETEFKIEGTREFCFKELDGGIVVKYRRPIGHYYEMTKSIDERPKPTPYFYRDIDLIAVPIPKEVETVEEGAKKIKIAFLWELIEDWQMARDKDEDIHLAQFSHNDIEASFYEKMEEIDGKKERQKQQQSGDGWISVEKDSPEPEENCLWCKVPVQEPPYSGSMCDEYFQKDYYTHFMRLPNDFFPEPPKQ